jgi:hypothetical protein
VTWILAASGLGVMWAWLAVDHESLAAVGIAVTIITVRWLSRRTLIVQILEHYNEILPQAVARAEDELERRRQRQEENDHHDRER